MQKANKAAGARRRPPGRDRSAAEGGEERESRARGEQQEAARANLDEGLRREIDLFALTFSSADKDEGVRAFLEKRKPDFKGV